MSANRSRIRFARLSGIDNNILVINYLGLSLSGQLSKYSKDKYPLLVSEGPNDGLTLLTDIIAPNSLTIVAFGSDHFFAEALCVNVPLETHPLGNTNQFYPFPENTEVPSLAWQKYLSCYVPWLILIDQKNADNPKIDKIKSIATNISLLFDRLNDPPTVAANNKSNNASVESTPEALTITTDRAFNFSKKTTKCR